MRAAGHVFTLQRNVFAKHCFHLRASPVTAPILSDPRLVGLAARSGNPMPCFSCKPSCTHCCFRDSKEKSEPLKITFLKEMHTWSESWLIKLPFFTLALLKSVWQLSHSARSQCKRTLRSQIPEYYDNWQDHYSHFYYFHYFLLLPARRTISASTTRTNSPRVTGQVLLQAMLEGQDICVVWGANPSGAMPVCTAKPLLWQTNPHKALQRTAAGKRKHQSRRSYLSSCLLARNRVQLWVALKAASCGHRQ